MTHEEIKACIRVWAPALSIGQLLEIATTASWIAQDRAKDMGITPRFAVRFPPREKGLMDG